MVGGGRRAASHGLGTRAKNTNTLRPLASLPDRGSKLSMNMTRRLDQARHQSRFVIFSSA